MDINLKCENCWYATDFTGDPRMVVCRRFPPKMVPQVMQHPLTQQQVMGGVPVPTVVSKEWGCGEFKLSDTPKLVTS